MPSPLGLIRRFGGNVIGNATSYAMGAATADTLRPELQSLVNETNKLHPVRPPSVGTLAMGVAQGQVDPGQAAEWASQQGFGADAFAALVDVANTGPGVPVAFDLWRRNVIGEDGFRRAAKRQGLEAEWIDDLVKVKQAVLDEAQIANAIHRGLISDPGLLPVDPPTSEGKVKAYPVYPIDALAEAEARGLDRDRLGVLVGLTGLPMGSHEAAQATFRGVIEKVDYDRAIAEGNTRNEWGDAIFEQSRQILTATEYIDAHLRGWITEAEMIAGTARHGMSEADTRLLFEVHGRPVTLRQVLIGEARGGTYKGDATGIPEAYLKALQQGSRRPEWYNIEYASRYSLPSSFVIRRLQEAGDISPAEAETLYVQSGWPPDLAAKVAGAGSGGGTATTKEQTKAELMDEYAGGYITQDQLRTALTALGYTGATLDLEVHLGDARRVKRWREKAVDEIGKAYIGHEIDETVARADLAEAGVVGEAADLLIPLWNLAQRASVKTLTAAQVKAAYKKGNLTLADALVRLEDHGLSAADANVYLTS